MISALMHAAPTASACLVLDLLLLDELDNLVRHPQILYLSQSAHVEWSGTRTLTVLPRTYISGNRVNLSPSALVCTTSLSVKFIQVSQLTKSPFRVSPLFSSTSIGWPVAAVKRPSGSFHSVSARGRSRGRGSCGSCDVPWCRACSAVRQWRWWGRRGSGEAQLVVPRGL